MSPKWIAAAALLCSSIVLAGSQSLGPEVRATDASASQESNIHALAAQPAATYEELLLRAEAGEPVRVIVGLALGQDFQAEGLLDAAELSAQRNRIAQVGDRVLLDLAGTSWQLAYQYESLPALALTVDEKGLRALRASASVESIQEDALSAPMMSDTTPLIGATNAWSQGYDGTDWAVAIFDTGIDGQHAFFRDSNGQSRVVAEACFSNAGGQGGQVSLCPNGSSSQTGAGAASTNTAACNYNGSLCNHGTHVAGTVAGYTSGNLKGVAPNAGLIGVQVFSRFNSPSSCAPYAPPCLMSFNSDQLAAFNHINTTLRQQHQIASINMSLGGGGSSSYCDSSETQTKNAIDTARSHGIATVIANGNDGRRGVIGAPACISTSIAVGATNKNDTVASYSDVAGIMDLFAPGTGIQSSVPGGGYANMQGTSMATPHVAGAWAVLRQAANDASVTEVLNALVQTGPLITDQRSGGTVTKPRIQVDAALAYLLDADTWTVTPSVSGSGGGIQPSTPVTVAEGGQTSFTLNPDPGFVVDEVTGSCGGTLTGNVFQTSSIYSDCTVVAHFELFSGEPLVCGSINQSLVQNGDGSTFDFVSGQFGTYDFTRADDINLYDFGDGMYAYWYGDVTELETGGAIDGSGEFAVLQPGQTVGPALSFSAASVPMSNWVNGADGYLGIAFENTDTGLLNYGWIQMTTSGNNGTGYPATWGEYCYDQTGAAITIPMAGDYPEIDVSPGSLSATVAEGGSSTQTLTIANQGDGDLVWSAWTSEVSGIVTGGEPGPVGAGTAASHPDAARDARSGGLLSLPSPAPFAGITAINCDSAPDLVIHDGGDIDNGYSANAAVVHEVTFVERFEPPVYPALLGEVCVSFVSLNAGPVNQVYELVVFADDGPGGAPGTELGAVSATAENIPGGGLPPSTPWFTADLSSLNITVSTGGVYVGVRFDPAVPDSVFIASDESSTKQTGYWLPLTDSNDQWEPIESVYDDYRTLFIRVQMPTATGCVNPDAVSWLSLDPASGTVAGSDSAEVDVTIDASGLTAGTYEALICIEANDPLQPMVEVPYTLTVLEGEEPDDLIFEDRFIH